MLAARQLTCSTNKATKRVLCNPAQAFKSLDRDREQGRRFRREVSLQQSCTSILLAHAATVYSVGTITCECRLISY
jgi:hypothetical protein